MVQGAVGLRKWDKCVLLFHIQSWTPCQLLSAHHWRSFHSSRPSLYIVSTSTYYCRKKHTIYVNFFRQMKLFFTAMALLTTMGQPSALMTRIMTLTLAAVQQLAPHIPRDPTGSTPVGSSSSWAKSLAGVRALFFTGLGPLPLFLGLLTSVAEPVCFLLALVFFCWIQLQLQKKVVLQPFLLKF